MVQYEETITTETTFCIDKFVKSKRLSLRTVCIVFPSIYVNYNRFIILYWWLVRVTLVVAFGPKILGGGWNLLMILLSFCKPYLMEKNVWTFCTHRWWGSKNFRCEHLCLHPETMRNMVDFRLPNILNWDFKMMALGTGREARKSRTRTSPLKVWAFNCEIISRYISKWTLDFRCLYRRTYLQIYPNDSVFFIVSHLG